MPRCAKCEGSSRKRPNHSQCRGGNCTCMCRIYADTVKPGNLDNLNLLTVDTEDNIRDEKWIEQLDKVRDFYKEQSETQEDEEVKFS